MFRPAVAPDEETSRTRRCGRVGAGAALAFALACASSPPEPAWTKPGGSAEELERVRAACDVTASRKASENAPKRVEARDRKFYFNECMNQAGWFVERTSAKD